MVSATKDIKSLFNLDLSGNKLDDECLITLADAMKSLTSLNLSRNKFTDSGIEILAPYLSGNIKLKVLDLSSNPGITNSSVPLIIDILVGSEITQICLSDTSISEGIKHFIPLTKGLVNGGEKSLNLRNK